MKIRTRNRSVGINVQVPTHAQSSGAGELFGSVLDFGMSAAAYAEKKALSDQERQVREADLLIQKRFTEAHKAVLTNPDYSQARTDFDTESAAIREAAMELGLGEKARQRIGEIYELRSLRAGLKTFEVTFQREVEENLGLMSESLQNHLMEAGEAETDARVAQQKAESSQVIQGAVDAGWINEARATAIQEKQFSDMDEGFARKGVFHAPKATLERLWAKDDSGKYQFYPHMDVKKRTMLAGMAEERLRLLEQLEKQRLKELSEQDRQGIADLVASNRMSTLTHGETVPGFTDKLRAFNATDEEIDRFLKFDQYNRRAWGLLQQAKRAPASDFAALQAGLAPQSGDLEGVYKREGFANLSAGMNALLRERGEDPAAYVDRYIPMEERPDGAEPTFADLVSHRMARQETLGILTSERRALTKNEAESMVAEFKVAPPDEMVLQAQWLASMGGGHSEQVAKELLVAGMPWTFLHLADPRLDRRVARVLTQISGDDATMANLKKDVPGEEAGRVLDGARERFRDEIAPSLVPGSSERTGLRDVFEKLAMYYAGRNEAEPVEKAFEDLHGRYYHFKPFNQTQLRIPKSYDEGMVEKIMRYGTRVIERISRLEPDTGGVPMDLYAAQLRTRGGWVTNADESGAYLYLDDMPVLDQQGQVIEIRFDAARGLPDKPALDAADADEREALTGKYVEEILNDPNAATREKIRAGNLMNMPRRVDRYAGAIERERQMVESARKQREAADRLWSQSPGPSVKGPTPDPGRAGP